MKASWIAFALRRAWAQPLRTAVAIVTCSFAWFSIQGALFETQELARQAERSQLLGGETGYQLEMQRAQQSSGVLVPVTIPAELLNIVHDLSSVQIRQLKGLQTLLRDDRARTVKMTVLFYDDALTHAGPVERRRFPVCSFVQIPEELKGSSFLVFSNSNWRCDLIPLPDSLEFLRYNRTMPALALPISTMKETVGLVEGRRTDAVWFGTSSRDATELIRSWASDYSSSPISLKEIGRALSQERSSLSQATLGWVIGSLVILVFGVGIYVQGTHREMKRELALRLCVGTSIEVLCLWFALDVGIQVLNMIGIAFVIAFILQYPTSFLSVDAILNLLAGTATGLLLFVGLISLLIVPLAARGRNLANDLMG
jgi:hypothetical protein